MTIRAMGCPAFGKLAELGLVQLPDPVAAAGEVVVRVVAAALNPADLKIAHGEFAGRVLHARTKPCVTGYDLSGVVETCGAGVTGLAAGDEVFGFLPYAGKNDRGSFGEKVAIRAEHVAKKPAGVSHVAAAAAATSGLSALQSVRDDGRLPASGGRVLVIGAAGGVGSIAVGVAKALGATVTAVCSTPTVDFVRGLGADEVVDRRQVEPASLAGPFDVVFDASAAYGYAGFRRALAKGGAFVTTLPSGAFVGGKLLSLFSSKRCQMLFVKAKTDDLALLGGWIAAGKVNVGIDATFPVKDLAAAFAKLESGGVRGKIAIQVDGGF